MPQIPMTYKSKHIFADGSVGWLYGSEDLAWLTSASLLMCPWWVGHSGLAGLGWSQMGWLIWAPCGLSLSSCAHYACSGDGAEKERGQYTGPPKAQSGYTVISIAFYRFKQATWPNSKSRAQEVNSTSWKQALKQDHIAKAVAKEK